MADGGASPGDVRVLSRLLAVSAELGRARTAEHIARVVIELGIDAVGASYGGIWLLDSTTRTLRMLAVSKLPRGSAERWSELSLDVDAPIPDAIRSGEPIFVTLAEYEQRYAASLARIRDVVSSPDPAYANLPLRTGAGTLGALALTYERAADLDATERMFLTILANQCAIALERVQLDEAERHARHLAEEATRAREEILSMVSHDLRNPLGTILMGAQTLLLQLDDPARTRITAQRIHRQAERMARLIEDLVDFAAIQAGKITLDRRPHAPDAIVRAAAELFAPLAAEREVRFDVRTMPDQPPVTCDAERAAQVLSNLLSNALKVTPRSGTITLGVEPNGVFYVRDTGPGIDADELPRLFERYWRSKHSTYKGAGLGLSIAKGIVDAHGGTIWVTSAPGAGSTFRFTLG